MLKDHRCITKFKVKYNTQRDLIKNQSFSNSTNDTKNSIGKMPAKHKALRVVVCANKQYI